MPAIIIPGYLIAALRVERPRLFVANSSEFQRSDLPYLALDGLVESRARNIPGKAIPSTVSVVISGEKKTTCIFLGPWFVYGFCPLSRLHFRSNLPR